MNIFKKSVAASLFAVLCCLIFTSCDADRIEAMTLDGYWIGDFGMFYDYSDRSGRPVRLYAEHTEIHFNQWLLSDHGTGTQRDYYRTGPYQYMYYDFTWRIENGTIKMRYRWAQEWDTNIYKYSLTRYHFSGQFDDGYVFRLQSTDNAFSINNSYYNNYGYGCDPYAGFGYDPYHYYAPSRTKDGTHVVLRDSADYPALDKIVVGNIHSKCAE